MLDFRQGKEYYQDTTHHLKLALTGKQDLQPSGDDTDSIYYIEDMTTFSTTFINSLRVSHDHQNLAMVSDSLYEVEAEVNSTTYKLEVYYKTQYYDTDGHITNKYLDLDPDDLEELTEDNFQEKIDLGFDIRNVSQLRYFLSTVYHMKAKSDGLILLSFDNEDSLGCKEWRIDVDFDLEMKEGIVVTQSAVSTDIPCKDEWRSLVYGSSKPPEEEPTTEKVG